MDQFICHASLWSADGNEPRNLVYNPSSAFDARVQPSASASTHSGSTIVPFPAPSGPDEIPAAEVLPVRNLLGSLTTSARHLKDEHGDSCKSASWILPVRPLILGLQQCFSHSRISL